MQKIHLGAALVAAMLLGVPSANADDLGGGADAAAYALQSFAKDWMAKLKRVESDNRAKPSRYSLGGRQVIRYRGYSRDFDTELKETGDRRFPYVGIIRYTEREYSCPQTAPDRCRVLRSTPVTELFRYENGRWIY